MATSQIAGMSDTQWDALLAGIRGGNNTSTPTPVGPTLPKATTPIPTPSTGTNTMTLPGPYLGADGTATAGKTVTVPTPTPNKTVTTPIQNGTLQGPYLNPNTGQYQQGANVANGQIQYEHSLAATPTPTVATPQQGIYQDPYARTPEQIAALAKSRIDAILQAGKTSANGALTGAKNVYDYENTITGDNRTLRNASMKESANPFGGQFGYQAAQNNRNDSISDTAHDKDYQANVGLINQKLADLQAAAPGQEQQIIDDLQQIERQTGISVAQLQLQQQNQQFNQGMQNQQFNQQQQVIDYNQSPNNPNNVGQTIQNQLAQYQLDNYPAEAKAKATLLEQQVKSGALSNEAATYNLQQLKDPNSPTNQAAKLDLQMKQIDASTYSQENKLKLQQLQKQIADIGVVHKAPQTAAELEYDQQQVVKIKAEIAKLNSTSDTPKIDPKESTDNLTFYQSQLESRPNLSYDQQMAYAKSQKSGLSDSDYNNLIAYINKANGK